MSLNTNPSNFSKPSAVCIRAAKDSISANSTLEGAKQRVRSHHRSLWLKTLLPGLVCLILHYAPGAYAQINPRQIGAAIEGTQQRPARSGSSLSMARDGLRVAVGEGFDGKAKVFEWNGNAWVQMGGDIFPDGGGSKVVSFSGAGDRVAVGGANTSQVKVFQWDAANRQWVLMGVSLSGGVSYGTSVSLSTNGEWLAVGESQYKRAEYGKVIIYRWNNNTERWDLNHTIEGERWDRIGISVSLSRRGEDLAISASGGRNSDGIVGKNGSIKVYRRTGLSWALQSNIRPINVVNVQTDANVLHDIAVSISADGRKIVIGLPEIILGRHISSTRTDHAVMVYEWNGNAWTRLGNTLKDIVGTSVAISANGQRLLVGGDKQSGRPDATNLNNIKAVIVYDWNPATRTWREAADFHPQQVEDATGRAVTMTLNGEKIAYGVPQYNQSNTFLGAVRVYDLEATPTVLQDISNKNAIVGVPLRFTVPVRAEHDAAAFQLSLNANPNSNGMQIRNGQFTWTPQAAQVGVYQVTISIPGSNPLSTKTFTITVAANQAPTAIALSTNSIKEGLPAGTFVGDLSTTDPNPNDTHTYTVQAVRINSAQAAPVATPTDYFDIGGLQRDKLVTAAQFNHDTQQSFHVTIRSQDSGGATFDHTFTINVVRNQSPTEIRLSPNTIAENSPVNTVQNLQAIEVGTLSTADPDDPGDDAHTYTLVAGAGDTDNASFDIIGNKLVPAIGVTFNFETKANYSVRIKSADKQAGRFFEKQFQITVLNRPDAPVIANIPPQDVREGGTLTFPVRATDEDLPAEDLTYELDQASLDLGMTITKVSNGEATFRWVVPAEAYAARYAPTITVKEENNNASNDSQQVTINIAENNTTPVIHNLQLQPNVDGGIISIEGVPQVVADAQGNFVVAWWETTNGSFLRRYALSEDGTVQVGNQKTVSRLGFEPAIAMARDGSFVITWSQNDQVKAQRYTIAANGDIQTIGRELTVSGNGSDPAIAMASDGSFVVTWQAISVIMARRYTLAGDGTPQAAGNVFRITDNALTPPAIAMSKDGSFLVAWNNQVGVNLNIEARRYTPGSSGTPQPTGHVIRVGKATNPSRAFIAASENGSCVIVWRGENNRVMARRYILSANGAPQAINNAFEVVI